MPGPAHGCGDHELHPLLPGLGLLTSGPTGLCSGLGVSLGVGETHTGGKLSFPESQAAMPGCVALSASASPPAQQLLQLRGPGPGSPAWGLAPCSHAYSSGRLALAICPAVGASGPHVQAALHVVQSWMTGAALSLSAPSTYVKQGSVLPRPWHQGLVCGEGCLIGSCSYNPARPCPSTAGTRTHTGVRTDRRTHVIQLQSPPPRSQGRGQS